MVGSNPDYPTLATLDIGALLFIILVEACLFSSLGQPKRHFSTQSFLSVKAPINYITIVFVTVAGAGIEPMTSE